MAEQESANSSELQLVIFRLGAEEFGVEITRVKEIIRMQEITRVPRAPHFLEGVINLRGKIIPVIDLRKRLGWKAADLDHKARIIVIENRGSLTGFIVDAVTEVLRVPEQTSELPRSLTTDVNQRFITAIGIVGERLIILLDMDHILSLDERQAVQETVSA